jgi:hypothetical protein
MVVDELVMVFFQIVATTPHGSSSLKIRVHDGENLESNNLVIAMHLDMK